MCGIHVQSIFHSVIKAWESRANDLFVQNVAMGIFFLLGILDVEREWVCGREIFVESWVKFQIGTS